jgi:hypothetical protein
MTAQPETLFGPPPDAFVEAPDVEDLAVAVLSECDEFGFIHTAVNDGLRIEYVFETKPFDALKEEVKPHTVAKTTKASPLWRAIAGVELVIQFRETFWHLFTETQRKAVLHHEFTHVEIDPEGRLSLRPHDVEEFTSTVRRFGPYLPNRVALVKAAQAWQHEQDHPEPVQLRPIDAVLDRVVDEVNAGALGPNVTAERVTNEEDAPE